MPNFVELSYETLYFVQEPETFWKGLLTKAVRRDESTSQQNMCQMRA